MESRYPSQRPDSPSLSPYSLFVKLSVTSECCLTIVTKSQSSGLQLEYQVDLDSVYKKDGSDRPVYKLAKVHTQERNLFELLVQVVFINNEASEQIKSEPFLIKTKRLNEELLGMSFRCVLVITTTVVGIESIAQAPAPALHLKPARLRITLITYTK